MANKEKWCYYSFEVLDPDNPNLELRDFVQCQMCHAESRQVFYHAIHWNSLQKCLRCRGTEAMSVTVDSPRKPTVVKKNRPLSFHPTEQITIFPFQEPLSGSSPINQLRRLWWLAVDPVSAVAYGKQYGTDQAANLEWWLGCTLIYLTGLFLTVSTLNFVTPQPLLYAGYLAAIFFVVWLINGTLGTHNRGWFLNLVGAALLGVVSAVSIFSVLTEPTITLEILENGLDVSINSITQHVVFRTDYIEMAGPAVLAVIAIALGIIPQTLGYRNLKLLVIHIAILVVGTLAIQAVPSMSRVVIAGMVVSIVLPVVLFLVIRVSSRSGWLTLFSAAIGLLLLVACVFSASAAASSLANLEPFPVTEQSPTPRPTATRGTSTLTPRFSEDWPTFGSQSEIEAALSNETPSLRQLANEQFTEDETDKMWQDGDSDLTFTLDLETPSHALWYTGWCAVDQSTLSNNLESMEFSFSVNGQSIPLDEFVPREFQDNTRWCYNYRLLLTEWPTGKHKLVSKIIITKPINDGFGLYPAATHTQTFSVNVGR